MRYQDDCCAELLLDRGEVLTRLAADDRIKRSERLVHQQDVRLGGKCTGNADTLLLSAREFAGKAVAIFAGVELKDLHQLVRATGGSRLLPPKQARHGGNVFRDRSMREQAVALDHIADPAAKFVRANGACILAINPHHTRIWLDQTIDHPQERCLARARGADHGSNRAWRHGKADTVNDHAAIIGLGQRVNFDHPAGLRTAEPWQRSISASINTAAANARIMVGTVPSRTRSMAIWLMP